MQVTLEQVREIIDSNDGNQAAPIASFTEIKSTSYSYTASWKSYHIVLSGSNRAYLLLVSPPTPTHPQPGGATPPGLITLPGLSTVLTKILDTTAVPVPRPVAHDVEGKWPFGWLLLRVPDSPQTHPSMSLTSIREKLSPGQLTSIELRLGTYLRALHGITNDQFGVPKDKPAQEHPSVLPSLTALFAASQTGEDGKGYEEDMMPYNWQDTFVLQLEELLEYVCSNSRTHDAAPPDSMDFDVGELRRSLTRAIGSFLFEDVELPRLIWVTGNEEDVILSLTPGKGGKQSSDGNGTASEESTEADIAYILPTFGHALWGDPLMETWFLPPGPTTVMKEGYFGGEGGTLITFPRHETKRVWYTVYLALVVLAEGMSQGGEGKTTQKADRETTRWARSILPECVEILKNAPCY